MVTVVIPTYNRPELTLRALASVKSQSVEVAEVIVVDDGSDLVNLESLQKGLPGDERLLIHSSNRGASAARNTGIDEASHDVVLFLDSDDVWLRDHVETCVKALSLGAGMVISQSVTISNGTEYGRKKRRTKVLETRKVIRRRTPLIAGSLLTMRQSVFPGGFRFDENLVNLEDFDLVLRAVLHQARVTVNPKVTVLREGGGHQHLFSPERALVSALTLLDKHGEIFANDAIARWRFRIQILRHCLRSDAPGEEWNKIRSDSRVTPTMRLIMNVATRNRSSTLMVDRLCALVLKLW